MSGRHLITNVACFFKSVRDACATWIAAHRAAIPPSVRHHLFRHQLPPHVSCHQCNRAFTLYAVPKHRSSRVHLPDLRLVLQAAPPALTWRELHRAAKLAQWSGFCYIPQDELPAAVAAEGLQLLASGRNAYTSWYIAEGRVPVEPLLRRAARPSSPLASAASVQSVDGASGDAAASASGRSNASGAQSVRAGSAGASNGAASRAAADSASMIDTSALGAATANGGGGTAFPSSSAASSSAASSTTGSGATSSADGEREVYVIVRGVHWGSPQLKAGELWSALMNAWPAPFLADHTRPPGSLLAHQGVAKIGEGLYKEMLPSLRPHLAAPRPGQRRRVTFTGHSLGGTLALLLLAQARLKGGAPADGAGGFLDVRALLTTRCNGYMPMGCLR